MAESRKNLVILGNSITQAYLGCEERTSQQVQFEIAKAKLLDWLQSLETRLNAGIFADRSTVDEPSLHEQLRELDKIAAECNALESEVEALSALLKPSQLPTDEKLLQGKFDPKSNEVSSN